MRSRPTLTLADAEKMMAACKVQVQKNKWSVSIAIVDDARSLILFERGDGIRPATGEAAIGKAKMSVVLQQPSKLAMNMVKENLGLMKLPGIPMPGGVPVMYQGECVGGIGVSGVGADYDEQIASAGAAAIT
jgi:glc operon protein GlcG